MNELTLDLFRAVAGAPLDEEWRLRVYGWLSALLKMPYLDAGEKKNSLAMLDYLESVDDDKVFGPMYLAARAKLSMEMPATWETEFPENYQVRVGNEDLTREDLRRRGIAYVDFKINKPIRDSIEYTVTRRLYADGSVEIIPDYQVFSSPPTGERHVFNVYGEKAVAVKQDS